MSKRHGYYLFKMSIIIVLIAFSVIVFAIGSAGSLYMISSTYKTYVIVLFIILPVIGVILEEIENIFYADIEIFSIKVKFFITVFIIGIILIIYLNSISIETFSEDLPVFNLILVSLIIIPCIAFNVLQNTNIEEYFDDEEDEENDDENNEDNEDNEDNEQIEMIEIEEIIDLDNGE